MNAMLKIGVAQADFKLADRDANLETVHGLLQQAGQAGIDVLTLPELANSGYNFESLEQAQSIAEVVDKGPFCRLLREWSAAGRLAVGGLCERADGVLYNSAVIYADGRLGTVYRKAHLFANESRFFRPGDEKPPVVDFREHHFGVMICFDWFFPEMARSLALRGAQIILHPSNLVLPCCQKAMLTRSIENRVFTATANRIGTDRDLSFSGLSQVTSPTGDLLVQADGKFTGVVYTDVDLNSADNKWVTKQNNLFENRRPELYDDLFIKNNP
jgi:predicted amidohydrolase